MSEGQKHKQKTQRPTIGLVEELRENHARWILVGSLTTKRETKTREILSKGRGWTEKDSHCAIRNAGHTIG